MTDEVKAIITSGKELVEAMRWGTPTYEPWRDLRDAIAKYEEEKSYDRD